MSGDGDEVAKPADITTLDYEPELSPTLSASAPMASRKADEMDYIAGFTLKNHVSAREIQKREVRFRQPVLDRQEHAGLRAGRAVSPGLMERGRRDLENLWVTCDVNGKQRLRSNTGD